MKLEEVLKKIKIKSLKGNPETEISGINIDSRQIKPGHLFVAIKGTQADGHNYIPKAIEQGAVAVLCETMPDAEILQTLYEKMQYSPLLVMDQKRFYLDELNRVWAALPADWRQETEAFVRQAEKLVRMSENRRQGRDTGQENRE